MSNPLSNEEFLRNLALLKFRDRDRYMNLVFQSLSSFPDEVFKVEADVSQKIKSIQEILNHFESQEEYEKCSFLVDILNRLKEHGKEGSVLSDKQ